MMGACASSVTIPTKKVLLKQSSLLKLRVHQGLVSKMLLLGWHRRLAGRE